MRSKTRVCGGPPMRDAQRGVALAVSLVLLLVMTIIGISSLNTTALEEKMSVNIQEDTRAFEAAESGAAVGLTGGVTFDVYNTTPVNFTFGTTQATVEPEFQGWSPPKRGEGYSAVNFQAANFDMKSSGTAAAGARSVVHQGVGQIVNKE